jgi:3-hydroxymyristoyl/3-hydroxydecanoyl-(acyl carrier protein) dehydratase
MIEAAGQLANAVLRADSRYADAYLFHTKMSKVKFMGAFLPGDIMQSEVTVEQQMDSLFFTHVQIKRDETAMFSADMVFLIKEGEK